MHLLLLPAIMYLLQEGQIQLLPLLVLIVGLALYQVS